MPGDHNTVQQPSLEFQLEDTMSWLRFRAHLASTMTLRGELDRIWPEGTVPRQQEVAELRQRYRRVTALLGAALELVERRGTLFHSLVTLATRLQLELPESIRRNM